VYHPSSSASPHGRRGRTSRPVLTGLSSSSWILSLSSHYLVLPFLPLLFALPLRGLLQLSDSSASPGSH
ncbi:hypothetical protein FRC08_006804, partial [Ceratobasidium sp. 394]